ncbi:hypothetical protein DBT_2263 [Dissulfuribacter thermophilus]|uniref:Uncharacterized protein n=1 Tax=Dissulfuribacter thermophilus TaxID=1156395 RepID=A0A1B9F393_9BACT|nr:hypothetical protein DBT_2263 [Dissulfuribacter thermophilus]
MNCVDPIDEFKTLVKAAFSEFFLERGIGQTISASKLRFLKES